MQYVNLGNTGLKVSKIGFGNFITSSDNAGELANTLVKRCWEAGINFYDTAESYDNGMGEHQLGEAIKALNVSREELVIATKIFFGTSLKGAFKEYNPQMKIEVNQIGTSKKHLINGIKTSLKNLQLDYVDVVFCHRYDPDTPTLEVCQAMKTIIDLGYARYWGTSMWPAQRIVEAMHLADKIDGPRPVAEQCIYNLMAREEMESRYNLLFDEYGMGTTIYSPVGGGVLSGKYNDAEIPDGSRYENEMVKARNWTRYFGKTEESKNKTCEKLKKFEEYCKTKFDCTMAQMAIAWAAKFKWTSCALIGASRLEMLESNLKALE